MMPAVRRLAAALALLCLPALALAEPVIEVVDGVRHVRNGAEPLHGERTLHLSEQWRVNVEEEEELIGVVGGALAGPEGTVWLSDRQVGQILVFSATGEHMKTLIEVTAKQVAKKLADAKVDYAVLVPA